MARNSTASFPRLTQRVYDLLQALDIAPLTVRQLRTISQTWEQPFTSDSRAQRKLTELKNAGWVQSSPYAIPMDGRAPNYWQLTRAGYELTFPQRQLPRRRYFEPIGVAVHKHTKALADVLVHTLTCAAKDRLPIFDYHRENELRLDAGHGAVFPDAAFRIRVGERSPLFCIELDNGTERVQTAKDVESIERKVRLYDLYQANMEAFDPRRPMVVFITTRGERRLQHMLETAASVVSNPQRRLVYGTTLSSFLASDEPLTSKVFLDHRMRKQPLVQLAQLPLEIAPQLLARDLQPC